MPSVSEAIDSWLTSLARSVTLGKLSPVTERNYRDGIEFAGSRLDKDMPLDQVTAEQIDTIIDQYAALPDLRYSKKPGRQNKSQSSVSRLHSTLSVFFNDAQKRGWISASPMPGTYLARGKTHRTSDPKRKSVGMTGAAAILAKDLSRRDEFIIRILLEAGPRVGELCAADQADLVYDDMTTSWWLNLLHTKNGKPRKIPVTEHLVQLYQEYRSNEMTKPTQRPGETGSSLDAETALLRTSRGRRMTPRDVQNMLARACRGTGVQVTPHGLRHTSATVLLESGADLHVVRDLLGHSSVSVTSAYLDSADANLARTVEANPLSYAGRSAAGTGTREAG